MLAHEPEPDIRELKAYSETAAHILSVGTKYSRDKEMITRVFEWSRHYENKVLLRLAVIDGFYSTQLNRRLHGLEDLAEAFCEVGAEDETSFAQTAMSVLNATPDDSPILRLIQRDNIGEQKNGQRGGTIASLATKYIYFAANGAFPIYDALAKESYVRISMRFKDEGLPIMDDVCSLNYFAALNKLKALSGIQSYDMLDNLLWFLGKINRGSLSLIIPAQEYDFILSLVGPRRHKKSKDIDKSVRDILADETFRNTLRPHLGDEFLSLVTYSLCQLPHDDGGGSPA